MCVLQPSAPFQGEQFMFSSCYRFLWKKKLQLFFGGCWTGWPTICRLSNPSDVTSQHFDSTWRRTGWNYRSYAIMRRLGIPEYQSRFVARFPNRLKLGVGTLETFLGFGSWIENHRPTFDYRPIAIFETRRSSLLGARMKWKSYIKFAWENLVSWTDSMYNDTTRYNRGPSRWGSMRPGNQTSLWWWSHSTQWAHKIWLHFVRCVFFFHLMF